MIFLKINKTLNKNNLMKNTLSKSIKLSLCLLISLNMYAQNPSAIADFESPDQGILIPRTDTTSVNAAYSPPATGLLIYQTTDAQFYVYEGTKWIPVGVADADGDPTNELISSGVLDVDTLKITEAGVTTHIELSGIKDNLGDHMATENLQLKDNYISNDGDDEGLQINNNGGVTIGTGVSSERFVVKGDSLFPVNIVQEGTNTVLFYEQISNLTRPAQNFQIDTTGNLKSISIVAFKPIPEQVNANLVLKLHEAAYMFDEMVGVVAGVNFTVSSLTDSVHTITFTPPIPVVKGDYYAISILPVNSSMVYWRNSDSPGGSLDVYPLGDAWIYDVGSQTHFPVPMDYNFYANIEVFESNEVDVFTVNNDLNVVIGNTSGDESALLQLNSEEKGFLLPRMTNAQIEAIANPSIGLQVYSLEDKCIHIYDGCDWLLDCALLLDNTSLSPPSTFDWSKLSDFPGTPRSGAVSFALGNNVYVGTGRTANNAYTDDFYKYNIITKVWTSVASLPGGGRHEAVAFTIADTAYVGTGKTYGGPPEKKFYKYNESSDTWTAINDFYGLGRTNAVAFTLNNKGYVGTGTTGGTDFSDFYGYDPRTGQWNPNDVLLFPGGSREGAIAIEYDDKIYFGLGRTGGSYLKDFYRLDETYQWTTLSDISGLGRSDATGFIYHKDLYIGTGSVDGISDTKDFYRYDIDSDSWFQIEDFLGIERRDAVAFNCGEDVLVGLGKESGSNYLNDFYGLENENYVQEVNANNEVVWKKNSFWNIELDTMYNINEGPINIDGNNLFIDTNNSRVGIGLSNPGYQFHVSTNSAAKPTSSAWTVASDERLKNNVQVFTDGLELIKKIDPVWFNYNGKANMPINERGVGTIAQELQKIAPYMVKEWDYKNSNGINEEYLAVDYGPLDFIIVNAIKEQQDQIEALSSSGKNIDLEKEEMKVQIQSLKDFNNTLQTKFNELEDVLKKLLKDK
jgi:N-acetylneuraminic acid mutarotase